MILGKNYNSNVDCEVSVSLSSGTDHPIPALYFKKKAAPGDCVLESNPKLLSWIFTKDSMTETFHFFVLSLISKTDNVVTFLAPCQDQRHQWEEQGLFSWIMSPAPAALAVTVNLIYKMKSCD